MDHLDSSQSEVCAEIALARGISLSADDLGVIDSIYAGVPTTPLAESLVAHFDRGGVSSAVLTYMVPHLWGFRPDRCEVPMESWRSLFAGCHYTHDFEVTRRPLRWWGRTLYRGATSDNRFGLSWTGDIEQARYFARSRQAPGVWGSVWQCRVPASRVLARLSSRSWEDEYVSDVRGCAVTQVHE